MATKVTTSKPSAPNPKRVKKPKAPDLVVESVQSILALLRGIGPTLVGSASSLGQSAVVDLLANLKDPLPPPKEG